MADRKLCTTKKHENVAPMAPYKLDAAPAGAAGASSSSMPTDAIWDKYTCTEITSTLAFLRQGLLLEPEKKP